MCSFGELEKKWKWEIMSAKNQLIEEGDCLLAVEKPKVQYGILLARPVLTIMYMRDYQVNSVHL